MTTPTPPPTLEHYKLETEFQDGYVLHRTFEWDYSVRRETGVVKWKRGKTLGKGGFGEVWLEDEEGGRVRAVKCLERGSAVMIEAGVTRELLALITLTEYKHLFVELFGWYENKSNIFIAMEYMKHGDLGAYIKHPEQARGSAKVVTKQILEALKVIHEVGICHRDLKPQNILIASLYPIRVKLADFGSSKQTKNTALRTRIGTQGYFAPELLGLLPRRFRPGSREEFSYAIDMWSLGCLLHEMLTAKTPFLQLESAGDTEMSGVDFEAETDTEFLYDYCQGDRGFPIEILLASGVSRSGIGLIERLLTPNPSVRPTAGRTLQHPWLVEADPEDRIDAETAPHLDWRAPTPTFYVTEDECFNNFAKFLYREKSRLRIFFDDMALKELAPFAKAMVEGLFALGYKKEVAMQFSVLMLYDLAFLIDDSSSMEPEQDGERIKTLKETMLEITTIYDLANGRGIPGIRFLNSKKSGWNVRRGDLEGLFADLGFHGTSHIGTALQAKILDQYVWRAKMTKPILVIVITDGEPEGEPNRTMEFVLEELVARLTDDPTRGDDAVSMQFALVGDDVAARGFCGRLERIDSLGRTVCAVHFGPEQLADPENRRVILPKILLGAIIMQWGETVDYSCYRSRGGKKYESSDDEF